LNVGRSRAILAAALLAALAAGGVALAAWTHGGAGGGAGVFDVAIVGPSSALFHGNVTAANATALTLLQAAAVQARLTVHTRDYPGMGTYVDAIGGYEARGAAGWVYAVERGGAWIGGDRTAAAFPVHPGEALRWSWTEGGG
jgi:hypothetical protein